MKTILHTMKRVLAAALLVVLFTTSIPVSAANDSVAEGAFGENLTWRLDTEEKTLTVSGHGAMPNKYCWEENYYATNMPWENSSYDLSLVEMVVLEEGVTSIGTAAFEGLTGLRTVRIPRTVRRIGSCAFQYSGLREIVIPQTVQSVGSMAFLNCESLTDVTIEGSHAMCFGSDVFNNTPFWNTKVKPENGLYIIGSHLLKSETGAKKTVRIPDGITDIAENAFSGIWEESAELTELVLPKALKYIGSYAFYGCEQLAEVKGGTYGLQIDCCAFERTALSAAQLEKLQTLGLRTGLLYRKAADYSMDAYFPPCDFAGAEEVTIPAQVETVYPWTPYDSDTYTAVRSIRTDCRNRRFKTVDGVLYTRDGSVLVWYPSGRDAETFTVPDGVRAIGPDAFWGFTGTEIILPDSVRVIGSSAFASAENLRRVNLPEGLLTLESHAFYNSGIESIELPSTLRDIGDCCFNTCTALTSIRVPSTVRSVGGGCFANSTKLSDVFLSSEIDYIGNYGMEQSLLSVTELTMNDAHYTAGGLYIDGVLFDTNTSMILTNEEGEELCGINVQSGTTKINTTLPEISWIPVSVRDLGTQWPGREIFYEGTEKQWNQIEKELVDYEGAEPIPVHFNAKPLPLTRKVETPDTDFCEPYTTYEEPEPIPANEVSFCGTNNDANTVYCKVGLFRRYRDQPVTLTFSTYGAYDHCTYQSSSETVTVDPNGTVTNTGLTCASAEITVTLFDVQNKPLCSDTVTVRFYKTNRQLEKMIDTLPC